MDLNYLYYRHQVSLMQAAAAASEPARMAHTALAALYARRIAEMQPDRRSLRAA